MGRCMNTSSSVPVHFLTVPQLTLDIPVRYDTLHEIHFGRASDWQCSHSGSLEMQMEHWVTG